MRFCRFLLLSLLGCPALWAQISLDKEMPEDVQKRTGVWDLTPKQKKALEIWLDQNVTLQPKGVLNAPQSLYLSLNIENGKKLQLSDGKIYEVAPDDVPYAAPWITPFTMLIKPSEDPDYPLLIVNRDSGTRVRVKEIPAIRTAPQETPVSPTP